MKRKIKCKKIKKIKKEFTFEHLVYTNCDVVLNSSRDFSRLKLLQFDFRWDLFLFSLLPLNIRTIHALLGVRDRCHACLLLEHSAEGSLGYRWLLRNFGGIHCRQVPPHLYLHHRSIGFEGCRSWHRVVDDNQIQANFSKHCTSKVLKSNIKKINSDRLLTNNLFLSTTCVPQTRLPNKFLNEQLIELKIRNAWLYHKVIAVSNIS